MREMEVLQCGVLCYFFLGGKVYVHSIHGTGKCCKWKCLCWVNAHMWNIFGKWGKSSISSIFTHMNHMNGLFLRDGRQIAFHETMQCKGQIGYKRKLFCWAYSWVLWY